MFDFGSFFGGVKELIVGLIEIYCWVVVARVLISWINPDPYNPIVQFLRGITDPAIEAVRRIVPRFLWSTGLDFTPLILILVLQVIILALRSLHI